MSERIWVDDESEEPGSCCLSKFNKDLGNIFTNYFSVSNYDIPFVGFEYYIPFRNGLTQIEKEQIKERLGPMCYLDTEYDPIYGKLYRRVVYFENWKIYIEFQFEYESYEREIAGMYIQQVYPVQMLKTVYQEDPNAVSHLCAMPLEAPDLLQGL